MGLDFFYLFRLGGAWRKNHYLKDFSIQFFKKQKLAYKIPILHFVFIYSFTVNRWELFFLQPRAKGNELYKKVNNDLNLDEPEFFGLLFQDENENNVSNLVFFYIFYSFFFNLEFYWLFLLTFFYWYKIFWYQKVHLVLKCSMVGSNSIFWFWIKERIFILSKMLNNKFKSTFNFVIWNKVWDDYYLKSLI